MLRESDRVEPLVGGAGRVGLVQGVYPVNRTRHLLSTRLTQTQNHNYF